MNSSENIKLREITLDELLQKFVMDGNVYLKLREKNLKIKSFGSIFSELEVEKYRKKEVLFHFESRINQVVLMKMRNGLKMFLGNKDYKEKKQAAAFVLNIFKESVLKKNEDATVSFNFFYAFYLEFCNISQVKMQNLDKIDQDVFRSFFTMAAVQVIHLIMMGYHDYEYFKEHYNNVLGQMANLDERDYDYNFRQDLATQLEKHRGSEDFLLKLKSIHQPDDQENIKNQWIKNYGYLLTEDRRGSGLLLLDHSHLLDWESALISTYSAVGFVRDDWETDSCRENIMKRTIEILKSKKASRYFNAKIANFYLAVFYNELSLVEAS